MEDVDVGLFTAVSAVKHRVVDIQRWLDRGASLYAVNKRGQTALMRCSNAETLAWLIREGVAIDARDINGCTALMEASERGRSEIVRVLLEHGADVNAQCNTGRTALLEAALWHKPQVVRLLLDHGADVHVSNGGYTPLMGAAWPWPYDTEAVETLDLLLSHGVDVNAVDTEGKTALIHLLEDDQHDGERENVHTFPNREAAYEEIVRLLLSYHADTGMIDSKGNTALTYSVRRGLQETARLLLQKGNTDGCPS